MANCNTCKIRNLPIRALCPDCDDEGYPNEPCFQYEPIEE